jgi:hypothetical protein
MPCVYLPGPAPAVTVANNNILACFFIGESCPDQLAPITSVQNNYTFLEVFCEVKVILFDF